MGYPNADFWLNQILVIMAYASIAYAGGYLVQRKNVKVNYTRKINFFALYLIPLLMDRFNPFEHSSSTSVLRSLFGLAMFGVFLSPIRSRAHLLQTMFASFDRPEDRPHTLFWLSSQIIAGYAVLIPMAIVYKQYGFENVAFIPVLIQGLGDGLADPIGIRFGHHKYSVRTLFSKVRSHTRSIEGSAWIFLVGILALVIFDGNFTRPEFVVALLTVPLFTALAEAWSPHTWDTPFIFFVSGVTLFALKLFV